jgi:hypothetical protein
MKLEKLTPMYSYRGHGHFSFEVTLKVLTDHYLADYHDDREIRKSVTDFVTKECPKAHMKLVFGSASGNEYDNVYRDPETTLQGSKKTIDQLGSYALLNDGAVSIYPEMFEPENPNHKAYEVYKSCTDTLQTYTGNSIICADNIPGTFLCASDVYESFLFQD